MHSWNNKMLKWNTWLKQNSKRKLTGYLALGNPLGQHGRRIQHWHWIGCTLVRGLQSLWSTTEKHAPKFEKNRMRCVKMTTGHLCRWIKGKTEKIKIESMSLPGYWPASSKEIVFLLNGLSQIHSTACEASLRKQLSNGDHAQLWKRARKNKRKAKRYSEHVKNVTAASHHWIIFGSILWCGTKESFVKLTRSNFWTLNTFIALSSSAMSFAGWKVDGSCFSRIYLKDTTKWLVCVATKMWK